MTDSDKLQNHSLSLIFDAVRWTNGEITESMLRVMYECILFSSVNFLPKLAFFEIRKRLIKAGWNVTSPT